MHFKTCENRSRNLGSDRRLTHLPSLTKALVSGMQWALFAENALPTQ